MLHTPGHSKGSVCYLLEGDQGILTGDTLFQGGYGRYDFADGSFHELKESLRTLFHSDAPDDLPGRGMEKRPSPDGTGRNRHEGRGAGRFLHTPLEGLANELCEVVKLFYQIDGFSRESGGRRSEARGGSSL